MQTIIKPSAAIRQNYNEISNLCKDTGEPVFLTKNGEGDLVVMDINTYDQREKQLELREKLLEIEMRRMKGETGSPAHDVTKKLLSLIKKKIVHINATNKNSSAPLFKGVGEFLTVTKCQRESIPHDNIFNNFLYQTLANIAKTLALIFV